MFALALVCAAALMPSSSSAFRAPVVPQVDLIRLTGHLREPRSGESGFNDLTLEWRKKQRHFQLGDLRVMSGRRLPGDVLSTVTQYRPNFTLYGPDALLNRLDEAGPDDDVEILGYFRMAQRTLIVNEVRIGPPSSPTPG
jgi:hypothetical protein